jgi:hypothetical protein
MILIPDLSSPIYTQATGQPPISVDDGGTIFEDEVLYGNLLSNDSDPEGDPIVVTSVNGNPDAVGRAIFLASGAIVVVNADGSYFYDPHDRFDTLNDGESARDSFSYTIDNPQAEDSFNPSGIEIPPINAGSIHITTINGRTFNSKTSTQPPIAVEDSVTACKDGFPSGNVP